MKKPIFVKSCGNAFRDVGFDEVTAKNLKFRSHLMTLLVRYIQDRDLTQKEAAQRFHVSQPRISSLLHGKIDLFSVGTLLDMVERAGFPIYKKIATNTSEVFKKHIPMRNDYY